ncbi:MAG TPA: FHA domain-containing protein [Roseiflexaceae bacterium]|nr:FHA domain-containing protein [Roseiflexaceae bacterium]
MDYGILAYARRGGIVRRYSLQIGSMTIGSTAENDLVLEDAEVASRHVRIVCDADGVWVTDLGSSTGTFLNTTRLTPNTRRELRDGDILRIGPFFVRFTQATPIGEPADQIRGGAQPRPSGGPAPVVPPEVAARVPPRIAAQLPPGESIRRLPGGGAPPRLRPGERRLVDGASTYMQYMPPIYHQTDFLGRFLQIFESILDPLERTIDHIQLYFDPRVTPEELLPWLATWVDLVLSEKWPIDRRRELVHSAAELYRWRGTRRGLSDFIRIYSGVEPIIQEPGPALRGAAALPPHVFRVILELPDPEQIDRDILEAIIEAEKPAHTAFILELRKRGTDESRAP